MCSRDLCASQFYFCGVPVVCHSLFIFFYILFKRLLNDTIDYAFDNASIYIGAAKSINKTKKNL